MESITTSANVEIVDSWVMTLQKMKNTQRITENIEQKGSKQIQEIFLMEILLLMTIQMQMKTWKKQKKMTNCYKVTPKKMIFFYLCDLCSFETIFDDQLKQHKKSKHVS